MFILDPQLLAKPAQKRQAFLFNGLRTPEQDLKNLGSGLIGREGEPQSDKIETSEKSEVYDRVVMVRFVEKTS